MQRKHNPFVRPPTVERLEARALLSAAYFVSTSGDDANPGTDPSLPWRHIQKAFDSATPGSTVTVLPGTYNEKPRVNVSGNAQDGSITFQAQGSVVITGAGVPGQDVVTIANRSYVRLVGFEIEGNDTPAGGSGVRITESADHVELLNNRIHDIVGTNAEGISVFGTDPAAGISDVAIDGNEVYDCSPAPGEAVSISGNVGAFSVMNNSVHDVNSIGIDVSGGYGHSRSPATDAAHDGVVAGNRVANARWTGRGRYAAGIFVDGARDITVERNTCSSNDVGIQVAALRSGASASGVLVRDNLILDNSRTGLAVGTDAPGSGPVTGCRFTNNTLYDNGSRKAGSSGLDVDAPPADPTAIENNIICVARGALLIKAKEAAGVGPYNLFYTAGGLAKSRFRVGRRAVTGRKAIRRFASAATWLFADPRFIDPATGDFYLRPGSPAVNAGDPAFTAADGESDLSGNARVSAGRVDLGADEQD